ncbi:MAG: 4a-hydroxytetrahydrobiopterin dehydratase [Bacteroidota bacterium]
MPSRDALPDNQIHAALPEGWSVQDTPVGNRITREFRFSNFRTAMGFIVRVGFEAEAMDHHPELFNVYDRVAIALTTHDAGNRVTETDLELARRLNALADG